MALAGQVAGCPGPPEKHCALGPSDSRLVGGGPGRGGRHRVGKNPALLNPVVQPENGPGAGEAGGAAAQCPPFCTGSATTCPRPSSKKTFTAILTSV